MIDDGPQMRRAILERPHDVSLRPIYADWCEENHTDLLRAELIRLQHTITDCPTKEEQRRWMLWHGGPQTSHEWNAIHKMVVRESAIFNCNENRWALLGQLPWMLGEPMTTLHRTETESSAPGVIAKINGDAIAVFKFHHGFSDEIMVARGEWLLHGPTIVQHLPVRNLRFSVNRFNQEPRWAAHFESGYTHQQVWHGVMAEGLAVKASKLHVVGLIEAIRFATEFRTFPTAEDGELTYMNACLNWARRLANFPDLAMAGCM